MAAHSALIIVGAPRSGTNILRDVLCDISGFGTWPCDEINYIWRHGNIGEDTDEFGPDLATSAVKKYIRNEFEKLASRQELDFVVEKTCANALRVPFVDRIVPSAKYIFIYRDGMDVVDSAMKRWQANLDLPYLLRKIPFVPASDLPYYASRYLLNHVYRVFSGKRRLAFWGPKFQGMQQALENLSLEEVCALQWQRCVELASTALESMPAGRVASLRYETFVQQPTSTLQKVFSELDILVEPDALHRAVARVSTTSIGKGRANLSAEKEKRVYALIGATLRKFGYDSAG